MGKAKTKAKENAESPAPREEPKSGSWRWLLLAALIAPVLAAWLLSAGSAGNDAGATAHSVTKTPVEGSPKPKPKKPAAKAAASSEAKARQVSSDGQDLSWKPKTISVVLPCAGEGLFAKKTVMSVAESVPWGIGGGILQDIVVVDDGSDPPLSQEFLTPKFQKKYPLKLLRHDVAVGLMGAKSAGAGLATGDVIVFFDCHVAPQDDWYQQFLDAIAENYRRIVVPVITNLDIDTWKETQRSQGMAKCYLTWDADFKWVESTSPYMPVLSGGLLGISRRWWNETGGYDEGMSGWGGENVDQSLRSWLCGGEIVSLSNAFVAHMWRRTEDPRTKQQYAVSQLDAIRNKARAVLAWFDEYREKAAEYPAMTWVGLLGGEAQAQIALNRDVSNFEEVKKRLQCKPFAWFLWRFRDIYVEGGLLPPEVFKLREVKTGQCLTFLGPTGTHPQGRASATVLPCDLDLTKFRGLHLEGQKWHARNRDPDTGKCCSAIGSWNTDQCLVTPSQDAPLAGMVSTGVCDVSGKQVAPWNFLEPEDKSGAGKLVFGRVMEPNDLAQVKCLVVDKKRGQFDLGGSGLKAWSLKLASCKRSTWEKIESTVPIETKLYQEALERHASLFK